jgi:hypothetical protein
MECVARDVMALKLAGLSFLLTIALGACVGQWYETVPSNALADGSAPSANSQDDLVCTTEKPIGSNIPKQICRSREDIDREKAEAEAFVERINTPRPTPR